MGNKYFKFILITGAVVVWGIIIFQVINSLFGEKKITVMPVQHERFNYTLQDDTFSLIANYSDPFIPDTAGINMIPLTIAHVTVTPDSLLRPDLSYIQYIGMIRNPTTKTKIAIVNIHGKEYLVKEKKKIEKIVFSKIEKDLLRIVYNGRSFIIHK